MSLTDLFEFLQEGRSQYHVVKICKKKLTEAGFTELEYDKTWDVAAGGKYYVSPYPSNVIAFTIGENVTKDSKIKLAMAHTDSPCFKIKSNPEICNKGYLQVNVEAYGGMINSTWFDRPLGLAGKVVLKSDDVFKPRAGLFATKTSVGVIPNIAPHLDRDQSGKKAYEQQQELIPVLGMMQEKLNKDSFFIDYLASRLNVEKEDILSFDLYLCNMDKPEFTGMDGEFISSPRIDNVASVSALTEAITIDENKDEIHIIGQFDNEEIGSRSKQGADSTLLSGIIEKLTYSLGFDKILMQDMLARGFMLSCDGAHAFHPNYQSKSDPTNEVFTGKGVVVKTSSSQRYVTDSEATAIVMQICEKNNVKYQLQVNRSGMAGGQTLGPIASSYLPMMAADTGIPMLSMHSARELAHKDDYEQLVRLVAGMFKG